MIWYNVIMIKNKIKMRRSHNKKEDVVLEITVIFDKDIIIEL